MVAAKIVLGNVSECSLGNDCEQLKIFRRVAKENFHNDDQKLCNCHMFISYSDVF